MNLLPKFRKTIMEYFKKTLGYGYHCSKCDRNARISEAFVNDFAFDYVKFQCPGCKKTWGIQFKNNEITELVR